MAEIVAFATATRRREHDRVALAVDIETIREHVNSLPIEILPTLITASMRRACCEKNRTAAAAHHFYVVACASIRLADAGYLPAHHARSSK